MINYESQDYRPEQLSIYDLAHIDEILSEPVRYDWFAAELLRICRRADRINLAKLASVFPDVVTAYCYHQLGFLPENVRASVEFPEYYEYWIPRLLGKAGK